MILAIVIIDIVVYYYLVFSVTNNAFLWRLQIIVAVGTYTTHINSNIKNNRNINLLLIIIIITTVDSDLGMSLLIIKT